MHQKRVREDERQRMRANTRDVHISRTTHRFGTECSGFSLIEVLIATGILIFGILAIVKIFPAGLGVIQRNEQVMIATRLAEDMQERYRRLPEQLPDAIIGVDAQGAFITNIDPESLPDDATINSLDSLNRVIGEPHITRSNNVILVNFPQIAGLNVSPTADPELQNPRVYRVIRLGETTGSPGPAAFQPEVLSGGRLSGKVFFHMSRRNQYVRITYRWTDTNNSRTYYVENERQQIADVGGFAVVTVAAATHTLFGSNGTIIPQSWNVEVEEPITVGSMTEEQRQCGVIPLTGVTSGETVKVDYTLDNWRWITETETIPANGTVDLMFKDLLPERGLFAASANTGDTIAPASINYAKGTVTFNTTLANTLVRLTYYTGAEWAVQMLKPPATFTNAKTNDPEEYRRFADKYWDSANTGVTDYDKVLGFKQINAGTTVVVDYVDTSGRSRTGEMHTIAKTAATTPVFSAYPYEIKLYYPYNEIVRVRGASGTARVTWIDNARHRQVKIPTYLTTAGQRAQL